MKFYIYIFCFFMIGINFSEALCQQTFPRSALSDSLSQTHFLGFGQLDDSLSTFASKTLGTASFNQGQIHDPMQLIRGRVPDLAVLRPGGDPTESFQLRLRGINSLQADAAPLIVVDGLPQASTLGIDPRDIASITVLRDVAGQALYGFRGANGVIVIESKKPEQTQLHLSYQGLFSNATIANQVDFMGASEYISLYNRLSNNPNISISGLPADYGGDTDWQEQILNDQSLSHTHQVSLNVGTQHTQLRTSLNYRGVNGLVDASGFDQFNARLGLSQYFWDQRLRLHVQASATQRQSEDFNYDFSSQTGLGFQRFHHQNAPLFYAGRMLPTMPIFEPVGSQDPRYFQPQLFDMQNPVAMLQQLTNENEQQVLQAQARFEFKFTKDLSLSGAYHWQQYDLEKGFLESSAYRNLSVAANGRAALETLTEDNQFYEVQLNYQFTRGKHQLRSYLGHSYQYIQTEQAVASLIGLPRADFGYADLATHDNFPSNSSDQWAEEQSRKLSAFSLFAHYVFNEKWMAHFSLRHEGSSALGEDSRWAWFPAGGIAYNWAGIFGENSLLKTRLSYGISGNLPQENYGGQALIGAIGNTFFNNGQFQLTQDLVQRANPDLAWEQNQGWNLGWDLSWKQGTYWASIDIYQNKTTDLIRQTVIQGEGESFQRLTYNGGSLKSRGFTLSVGGQFLNHTANWSWQHQLNFGTGSTELISISTPYESIPPQQLIGDRSNGPGRWFPAIYLQEGEQLGEIWGRKFEDIDQNGRWVFEDNTGDLSKHGQALPQAYWSWAQQLRWKQWSLDWLLTGAVGHSLINTYRYYYEIQAGIGFSNLLSSVQEQPASSLYDFAQFSDFYTEQAGYARLDYLTLAYEFPLSEKSTLSKLSAYLIVQNLFTITNYQGVDPEVRLNSRWNPLVPGSALRNTYFVERTWGLGVQIGL